MAGVGDGRSGDLRAARGDLHARGNVRWRDRAAPGAARARRHRDRDHAGRGVPRRPQLGIRRRLSLRRAEHLRRTRTGSSAWWTPRIAPGSRCCSTWCTTISGPRATICGEFGPYFSDRYRTAWGEGFNLDGPDSDEVRRYLVDNAVYWVTEYHLDGLRLDAADRIVDLSPVHLAEEIGEAVHAQGEALGRRALVIAEIDANDPRWVRGGGCGRLRPRRPLVGRLPPRGPRRAHRGAHRLLRRLRRPGRRGEGARRTVRERRTLLAASPPESRPARRGRAGRPVRGLRPEPRSDRQSRAGRAARRPGLARSAPTRGRYTSPLAVRAAPVHG